MDSVTSIDFARLEKLQNKPPVFEPGDLPFWTDPLVQPALLQMHLDPTVSMASRPPDVVSATARWIIDQVGLQPGGRVLDLGCGPGLYCAEFARAGMDVTGIDFSKTSLEHARKQAAAEGLDISYRQDDYVQCDDLGGPYDAIVFIFGDFSALTDPDRDVLLPKVHDALRPGGTLVLDVTTPRCREVHGLRDGWQAHAQSFWRVQPHIVLTNRYSYDEAGIVLEQYIVIDESGEITLYRNWYRDYSADALTETLERFGFQVEGVWGDLTGEELKDNSLWVGAVARRR